MVGEGRNCWKKRDMLLAQINRETQSMAEFQGIGDGQHVTLCLTEAVAVTDGDRLENMDGVSLQAVTLADGTTAYIQHNPKDGKLVDGQVIQLEDGSAAYVQQLSVSKSGDCLRFEDGQAVQLEDGSTAFIHHTPKDGYDPNAVQAVQLEDGTTAYIHHTIQVPQSDTILTVQADSTLTGLHTGEATVDPETITALEQYATKITADGSESVSSTGLVNESDHEKKMQIVLQGHVTARVSAKAQQLGEKAFRCEYEGCGRLYTTAHHLKFVEFCGNLTEENPEVMNFLQLKYSKAFPDYLSSTEFRNVLGRCLTRVQGKKSKVFVYINELCTALKANSQRTKLALASKENSKQPAVAEGPEGQDAREQSGCPERTATQPGDAAAASTSVAPGQAVAAAKKKHSGSGSRRQIRYLENLLKVYADEIQRLQEKELDLNELEDEDSSYIQEHRLKKKMVKIFEKLCELKRCSSLTGRVIEQRIAFTGTRYPEINRKVERFINKPDHFPDYQDIRNIMQQVSIKHSLGLSQRQIQSMAQDVFREVGNRLQERRHLDLVYNFGSHLTDDYKPGKDPAMSDITLEKRLRSNRSIALGRLDDVVKKYTEIQDVGELEEEEKRKKKKKLLQSAVSSTSEASKAKTEEVKEEQEKVDESKGKDPAEEETEEEGARGSDEDGARGSEEEEGAGGSEEEEGARGSDEEEEEDEEEDSSSDPDIEEELSKIEEVVEAEEGPAQE
ncbi:hypothetical protein scyTo_0002993, partial [Scyliorhinus torazame]|nr:hypothetical protein [Scyliorhinus torazame]